MVNEIPGRARRRMVVRVIGALVLHRADCEMYMPGNSRLRRESDDEGGHGSHRRLGQTEE
jgi:hypothetical protein